MGKLIVFEGTDGSGKSTQFSLLTRRLEARGVDFRTMVFPQYTEPSSALIRMYLGGEFGARPSDVNAYTASTFYAVDRFAAFRKVWGEYYRNGGLMLSDRYTTSNAVHQASKEPEQDRERFFAWLYDLEYRHMGLPVPDLVLYLDVPTEPDGPDASPPRARYPHACRHPRAEYGLSAPLPRHGSAGGKVLWLDGHLLRKGRQNAFDRRHPQRNFPARAGMPEGELTHGISHPWSRF